MATQQIETVNSKLDLALVLVALLAALAGVFGFTFMGDQAMIARIGVLAAGIAIAAGIAWITQPGKRFLAFARDAYEETRRVVWPTRKETFTTTGIVFAFVVVMALFLFMVDKSIEWALYDLLLNSR